MRIKLDFLFQLTYLQSPAKQRENLTDFIKFFKIFVNRLNAIV